MCKRERGARTRRIMFCQLWGRSLDSTLCTWGNVWEVSRLKWHDLIYMFYTENSASWVMNRFTLLYYIILYHYYCSCFYYSRGRKQKQGEQLEAFTVTGQDIQVLSITWLYPSVFLSLFLSSRDFWRRKMHLPHLHILPQAQLCATTPCSQEETQYMLSEL